IGDSDLGHARTLCDRYGAAIALGLVPDLVQIVRRKWPVCKSFSGAVQQYLAEAVLAYEQRQRRAAEEECARRQQQREREEASQLAEERRRNEARWQALTDDDRRVIEEAILREHPEHTQHAGIVKMLCLERLEASGGRQP